MVAAQNARHPGYPKVDRVPGPNRHSEGLGRVILFAIGPRMSQPKPPAESAPQSRQSDTPAPLWLGYLAGALGASFFATKGIVIKLALVENVDAVTTLTWRMLIAVPIFALVGWLGFRDKRRRDPGFRIRTGAILRAAGVGAIGYYLASYLDFAGLEYISAQFDRLILLTYPIFVVLFGTLFFKRKVSRGMAAALGLSYFGLALIFAHDLQIDPRDTMIGASLVLGAAIAYAGYQIMAKPLIDEMGSRLFTSIALSAAGFAVVGQFLLTHQPQELLVGSNAMWLMLAIGTVSTVLPAYLIAAAIGIAGPEPTAVMGNVSPLITITLAVTILGEAFSIWHALGAAFVIGGIFLFTGADRRAARARALALEDGA